MDRRRFRVAGDYSGVTTDSDGNFYVSYPGVNQKGIYAISLAKVKVSQN